MILNRIATIAITSNICIKLPVLYTKNPKAQEMIKITAIK